MPILPSRRVRHAGAGTCAAVLTLLVLAASASARAPVTVSLTFDDGQADQYIARSMLSERGMHATFFINSGFPGRSDRLSWAQIGALAADGNEIGGHTINHTSIPNATPEQAKWEICDDRAALVEHGFNVTDFAYPYAFHTLDTDPIVAGCGYNSARGIGGIVSPGYCPYCDFAEALAPPYPMYTLAPQAVMADTSLDTLKGYVTQAEEHGGGWVQLVFHHICDSCDAYATTQSDFGALLDWLGQRRVDGTEVKTVQQVIGGELKPVVRGDTQAPVSTLACGGSACTAGYYRDTVAVTLDATDAGGSGLGAIRYTTDGRDPTPASPAYTAPLPVAASTNLRWRAYDRQGNAEGVHAQAVTVDASAPAVAIVSPRNGARVRGATALYASASDTGSGVASVAYLLDGKPLGAGRLTPGFPLQWKALVTGRKHTLTAVATDGVGHTTTSAPITVDVISHSGD